MGSLRSPQGLGHRYAASKRYHPPLAASDPAGNLHFDPPRRKAREANLRIRSCPRPHKRRRGGARSDARHDAQAGVPSAGWPRAQLAFKDSMVHGILQFTPSIALRYVLHRCESQDIRCRES